jgi:hypothetical protein
MFIDTDLTNGVVTPAAVQGMYSQESLLKAFEEPSENS